VNTLLAEGSILEIFLTIKKIIIFFTINFLCRYGCIKKKKAKILAIKHQYEQKLSDIASVIKDNANMKILKITYTILYTYF